MDFGWILVDFGWISVVFQYIRGILLDFGGFCLEKVLFEAKVEFLTIWEGC